jgi:3-oxoacyl-[acyl-carrier protein] reductase
MPRRWRAKGARSSRATCAIAPKPVEAITKAGGRALGMTLDVRSLASCQAMADAAMKEFGRVDALVNNAALYANLKGGRFDQLDEGQWDRVMQVNIKGVWNCCRAIVPIMRKQNQAP